jgi:hypothetical protein
MAQGYLTSPGSAGENDFSDVKLTTPDYAEVSPTQLPIRGEKRIIPTFVDITAVQGEVDDGIAAGGFDPNERSSKIAIDDFRISAAMKPFVDYISVRLPHRGYTNGKPDQTHSGVFRFLINPQAVQVNRTMVDGQSMTRAGWQFGVWGEDTIAISLSGKTAGQYFALGTTDAFAEFTQSYRNLQQLVMVYENNGYWFEGEELGEGPLAAPDFSRRRIKMHQDIELVCGNFIWFGMFDSLNISQDSENPFTASFTISFVAWKERFRTASPYFDSIHNDVQRGHSYSVYANYGQQRLERQVQQLPVGRSIPTLPAPDVLPPNPPLRSPAVEADELAQNFVTTDTGAMDQTPMFDIFNPNSPASIFGRS